MTATEITALAEAALRDRITTTFGVAGADAKGNTIIVRVLPPTAAELAWMAVCKPDARIAPEAWAPSATVAALSKRIKAGRVR